MPVEPQKLFLSYGRADASGLADRLAHDLTRHAETGQPRYAPWKDRVQLVAGRSWADQIAEALRDTAAVVALMSPHSVRSRADGRSTDDSVCLDEISFARFGARKPIVPVLVAPCTPPFEIFRLDYVDFTQWQDETAYHAAFDRLLDAIAAALRGETRYRAWSDRLQPWDYGNYLVGKRAGFVGRRWLFRALKDALADETRRAILITGGPGFGKSAFVAEYLHRNPDGRVLAFHCCQADTRETLSPGRFVRSIAAMIASRHPAYEALLDQAPYRDVLTEKSSTADPASAFEEGVLAALERVGPPRPGRWTLVVDALDEATEAPGDAPTGIVQMLAERIGRFPTWLTLVATSRPERSVLQWFANLRPLVIEPTDIANVRDLRRYVTERLAAPPLAALVAASGRKAGWAAKRIGDAAEGNFLYAEQALAALGQRLLGVEELGATTLPPGLTRQYRLFFGRRFSTDPAWDAVRPLFAVLVAAQEPLASDELAAAAGLSVGSALSRRLADMGAYVRMVATAPPRYFLFHRSLLEWLTGADEQGGRFAIDAADGHRRLADGLYAAYQADRFRLSNYALAHLATHLAAAAAGADPASRAERQRALADYVLDPVVQGQRLADPFGMESSLRQALQTVASGPPDNSVPGAIRLALGLEAFRRERLDASRIFDLAAAGQLAQSERELQLYAADEPWSNAARLVMAWLAIDLDRATAGELRARSQTGTVLDERVAAVFERREAVYPPIGEPADLHAVMQILLQAGGTEAEGVNPSMLMDQAAPPVRGLEADVEGTRYLAEFQAPVMVAFAQQAPGLGTDKLREYIALNAANAYRVYRNGSLWQILSAVARHPDPAWIREMTRSIVTAALAGRGWEFGGASPVAAAALRARSSGDHAPFDKAQAQAVAATEGLSPLRGRGDSWGEWRRSLAAQALARHGLFAEDVQPLLERALAIPPSYAGFQVSACIDLAATLAACGAGDRVDAALDEAERAAHNVQDLVFCARSVSRVHAFRRHWWPAAAGDAVTIMGTVRRLAADPMAPEFAALHVVGEQYPHRRVVNPTSRLPAWLLEARSLTALAHVYQWRLGEWRRMNPAVAADDTPLADGQTVRVPDPRFAPHLAAWFATRVLASDVLVPRERLTAILSLLPVAVADRTELDAVIACLLLAWAPAQTQALDEIDAALASHPLPPMAAAGPEGVA